MNADGNRTPSRDRVIELLSAEADQWLSGDGREELLSLLRSDPRARAAYVEHAILQSLLFHKARSVERRGARDEERGIEDLEIWRFGNLETTDLPLAASQFPLTPLPSSLSPSFIGGPVFSYMVATVVLALMLLGGWAYKVTYVRSVPSDVVRGSVTPAPVFVGRITGMKDCRWSDPNTRTLIGASVPLEREYSLSSGLMEITYGSGARVILEGPCTYRVESSAGGFLAIGKLTANIRTQSSKPKARSSNPSPLFPLASPLFSVRTPTATIADLGTEFGVEVDANGETTSHVFQGSVQVQILPSPASGRGGGGEGGKILRKDESIRVSRVRAGAHQDSTTAGGAGSAGGTLRFTHPAAPPKFVRRIYEPPKLIDLLDIVAGGNGTGNHRGKGIDPSDGKMTPEYVDARCLGDGQYWPVLWHRMIDGVFMPNGRDGAVQLDSAGHSFDGFPETLGDSWGSIWARSKKVEPNQDDNAWVSQITDVERFMPDGRGVLAFCPNVGLTFDLGAIHRKYSESRPVRFQAAAGLASSDIMPPLADGLVDLWIFVDGRLALKRIGLSRKDGPINLNVDLAPTDRFLTLVATDGGDGISSDWLILGDPVIKLVPAKAEKE